MATIETLAALPMIRRLSVWEGGSYTAYDHLIPSSDDAYGNVYIKDGEMTVSALVGEDRRAFIAAALKAGAVEVRPGFYDVSGVR